MNIVVSQSAERSNETRVSKFEILDSRDLFQEVGGEMVRLWSPEVVTTLVKDSIEVRVAVNSGQARRKIKKVIE